MDILYDKGLSNINKTLLEEGLIETGKGKISFIDDYFFEFLKNNSKILKLTDIANQPFKLMAKIKKGILCEDKLTAKILINKSLW